MTDPNADLIGETIQINGETWLIERKTEWSEQYVWLESTNEDGTKNLMCRPLSLVQAAAYRAAAERAG